MATHTELNPVSHLTIGTVGEPGNRTFYLQGSKGSEVVSVVIEKQQAAMLVNSFESLLEELTAEQPETKPQPADEQWTTDMRLREPVEGRFRVGNIGLGYSAEVNRIVVVAYELVADEEEEQDVVSYWASPAQVRSLIPHIESVVKSGRPICGNCGDPIDREGHFCPHRNGHQH